MIYYRGAPCADTIFELQTFSLSKIGNENSARSFSDRSFFETPSGHGRPRLRVMDVRTKMLVFPGFRGLDRSFCPRTSAGISAWTSAGYPAPKLTLWAAFSFLRRRVRGVVNLGGVVKTLPKGPFRTKNATALKIVVKYYRGSILLSVPIRCHFS